MTEISSVEEHHDHDHDHTHEHEGCNHHHGGAHTHAYGAALYVSLVITVLFVIAEAVVGHIAHSLALISDAGHNFSDALSLGLSAYALWIARKPANAQKTFGYHRVAILSALANSLALALISISIFVEALHRIHNPVAINSSLMVYTAIVALILNSAIVWILHGGAQNSLNIRATYIHMATDVIASIVVLITAVVIHRTGWLILDPIASIGIAAIIFASCWSILREATDILLEATPKGLDIETMANAIHGIQHVEAVHDLHAWTVSDGLHYMSCHIEVAETQTLAECACIVRDVNSLLMQDYAIAHSTIQVEMAGSCESATGGDPLYCGNMTPKAV